MRRGNWALFDRKRICDISDRKSLYLSRLYIIETPYFGIFLHAIYRKDHDRALHDHPWNFTSIILRGGYDEWWLGPPRTHPNNAVPRGCPQRSFHQMRRGEFHRIASLHRIPTWTLVFAGRRRGEWGYLTPDGWVESHEYHASLGLTEADDDF